MTPMATLLICIPAALLFIVCVCGVAVLWPTESRCADHPMVGRWRGRRSSA